MATDAELRAALAWESGTSQPPDKNVFEWLWQAVQGDFDDNRSTGQIAFDTAISMIPVVDQICDVRDIIANCRAIATSKQEEDTSWKWVALVLTLIGLFPTLGSLVKGVLKLFFVFIRRYGLNKMTTAVDDAMTWVITFLRKREVQKQLRKLKVDEVFKWLAERIKEVRGQVNTGALLQAFDTGIGVMKGLLGKVTNLPIIGARAKATIEMVEKVRRQADAQLSKALEPVTEGLNKIIHRLEMESLMQRSGILDTRNVHFRGTLPETRAVTLMKQAEPLPAWLNKGGKRTWAELKPTDEVLERVAKQVKQGWPELDKTNKNIKSFHQMNAVEIKGPAKLFRVISPSSGAMGDCWVPEDVWKKIIESSDPKSAWRKYLAVWPDWNANGQFAVMEIPAGTSVKAWRGPASSQTKDVAQKLDAHLEGGWDQIIVKVDGNLNDTKQYYKLASSPGEQMRRVEMTYPQYQSLPKDEQTKYITVRENINHTSITGPLDTGWGYTDFDPQLNDMRIGLPAVPGQVTNQTKK